MSISAAIAAPSVVPSAVLAFSRALPTVLMALVALLSTTVWAEDPVAVLITGPLSAKVGDRVAFEVELVNRSGRPLEKLRVIDYFDKGFHHDASASPIEQKGTIDLAAGTSRRLTLDFLLDEPGRQCHRVEILDQAHTFVGGATSCVQVTGSPLTAAAPQSAPLPTTPAPLPTTPAPLAPAATSYPATTYPAAPFTAPATPALPPAAIAAPLAAATLAPSFTPPPSPAMPPLAAPPPITASVPASTALPATPSLELDLVGPAEVLPGSVSEFVATVRNTGSVASGPTTLEFGWDDAFTPLEASEGYKLASSRVSWSLPSLEAGGELRRQINLRAQPTTGAAGTAARSCVRGVLSGSVGGVMVADESCVLIRSNTPRLRTPREAGLRLTLADCDDPVVMGHSTTLICTVVNNGTMSTGRIDLTVVLPDRASLVGDPSPSRVRIDGSNVTFDSIPSIAPGGQSTVELAYRIPGSGTAKATAILTGAELEGSLDSSCQTTFLAP